MKKKAFYIIGTILLVALVIVTTILGRPNPTEQQPSSTPTTSPAEASLPTQSPSAEESGIITDISEETTESYEELAEIVAGEGETQTNPFYKSGTDSGEMVYWVCKARDGQLIALPLNETVIYEVDGDSHYLERVNFSYKVDGKVVETTQYRVFVPKSAS